MVLAPKIQTRSLSTVWSPPPEGCIKINVDAALPKGMVYYSVAMVSHAIGEVDVADGGFVDFRGNHSRSNATRMQFLRQFLGQGPLAGARSIIIEGDCLQVISSLKEGESTLSSFGAYIDECLAIAGSFVFCDFSFVKRSENQLAHMFASNINLSCSDGTHIPHNLTINA